MLKTVWANTHMATQAQLPKNLRSRLRMELPEAPTNMVGFFYEFEITHLLNSDCESRSQLLENDNPAVTFAAFEHQGRLF